MKFKYDSKWLFLFPFQPVLMLYIIAHFSSVQSLSHVQLFATPWMAACQASLSITNSWSPSKPMSIESVMPSNHLILCRPLLLLPSIFPSIRVFSDESALHIRWPKYWSFSFNISPSNEHPGPVFSFRMDWLYLLAVQGTLKSLLQHDSSKAPIWAHTHWYIKSSTSSFQNTLLATFCFKASSLLGSPLKLQEALLVLFVFFLSSIW